MKKIGILLVLAFLTFSVDAQTTKKKTTKKPTTSKSSTNSKSSTRSTTKTKNDDGKNFWKDEMMYGAFVNYPSFGQGAFSMELSPFAGYKPLPFLAVGVSSKFAYNWFRNPNANEAPLQPIDLGFGAFTRLKFLKVIFLHGEITKTKYSQVYNNPSSTPQFYVQKTSETAGNIGAGYSSGGKFKTEIGIYYNLLYSKATVNTSSPFDFRLGMTYNF
jgi:hypothetical protein